MAPPGSMTASTVRVAIPLIAVGYGLVLLSFLFGQVGSTTSAGGLPKVGFRNLDLVIAIALVFSAGFTWMGGASRRVAVLAAVSGLAWLGPYVVLAPASPAIIRLVAVGLAPLWPVVVLHLVLAATSHGRPDPGRTRYLMGLYAVAAVLSVARVVTFDPFFEPDCMPLCKAAPAIIAPPGGMRPLLREGVHVVGLVTGAVLAGWSAHDLVDGGLRGRDRWTLVGGLIGGVATTGFALIELARGSTIVSRAANSTSSKSLSYGR